MSLTPSRCSGAVTPRPVFTTRRHDQVSVLTAIVLLAGATVGCVGGAATSWPSYPPSAVDCPPDTSPWERKVVGGTEATCKDGQQRAHGAAIRTNYAGEIDYLGAYEHGEKHGRWYHWAKSATPLSTQDFSHNLPHGEHRIFYATEPPQTSYVERYEHGERDGVWESWHRNGQRHWERSFCDGKACGTWRQWSSDGTLLFESTFDAQGNGPYTWYFDDGKPRVSGQYIDGVQAGEWTWFDEDSGEVVQRCLVEDGRSVECSLKPPEHGMALPP